MDRIVKKSREDDPRTVSGTDSFDPWGHLREGLNGNLLHTKSKEHSDMLDAMVEPIQSGEVSVQEVISVEMGNPPSERSLAALHRLALRRDIAFHRKKDGKRIKFLESVISYLQKPWYKRVFSKKPTSLPPPEPGQTS